MGIDKHEAELDRDRRKPTVRRTEHHADAAPPELLLQHPALGVPAVQLRLQQRHSLGTVLWQRGQLCRTKVDVRLGSC